MHTFSWLFRRVHPAVDPGDLRHPATSILVLEVQDIPGRPMEVVGQEGYLLIELIEGVA
jgi:hypothetical protein